MDNPSDSSIIRRLKSLPKPPTEAGKIGKKYALVIGNTQYSDPGLAQLTAPGTDAKDFARVLKDPRLCGFDDVIASIDQQSSSVIEAIDEFFDQKKPEDLLVLYFSGHGIRDEFGALYLAFKNTIRTRLRSSAIKADYIREAMDQSRSKRQVLILDCCNSGAFPQGTKAEVGGSMGMMTAFQGYGRYVLTASDATQFAWEGDRVIGKTRNSLFTHFLVKGLEGEADHDGDGRITVDDLYDYAFAEISQVIPNQTPTKSASKQAGDIILRQITRLEDIKPISLPDDLLQAIADSRTFVREGAVEQLEKYLNGKNLGWMRSAKEALEKMASEDDSLRVRQAAARALAPLKEAEPKPQEAQPAVQTVEKDIAPIVQPVPLVEERVEARKEATTASFSRVIGMPGMRRMIWGGAGLLILIVGVAAALLLRSRPASPADQHPTPPASVASSTGAAPALPVTGPTEATALSTVSSSTEAVTALPATGIPAGEHLSKPVDVAFSPGVTVYDADSSGTGPQGRAPYGDSYNSNRFERPFLKGMTYVSDLDILSFSLGQDQQWNYVSMQLAGSNPNNSIGIDYGVEIDLNDDGYGDYLIWARPPYTTDWSTSGVQVYKDTNHDTGAPSGNGYDTLIFNGGSSQDSDPDLAWVRITEGAHATVQFAFKRSVIGSSFLWGVIADAGLKDVSKFDYRFQSTEANAGSPVRSSVYYPLGTLYAIDNTCWEPQSIRTTGSELKVCPATKQQTNGSGGSGGGSSCNPKPSCQNYNPVTCLCP